MNTWTVHQHFNESRKKDTKKTEEECITQRQKDNGNKPGGCKVST